ncbi:ABC transporter permease [uncultured Bacteroides sp.]|uniref:ABC transporter permease n=1 Tax=uncultured Bacteroides sp. TaxID=162156 RepID=UPI0025CE4D26|nr:ABC transporter permease [uncultured Bacteroides sp.]
MIGKYLRQSFKLLKQNPLFSSLYIVGTGLAISMVMVLAVLYYIKVGDIYPETHRSRMFIASTAHMQNIKDNSWNTTWNYSATFIKECFYSLKGVEAVTAINDAESWFVAVKNVKRPLTTLVKLTDTGFWKVFDFSFVAGRPFTKAEFESGFRTAVISEDMARRVFGREDVVGESIKLNLMDYRVCGVVKSPSYALPLSYAQVWLPYTCLSGYAEENNKWDVLGPFQVAILLPSVADAGKVKLQVDEYVRKFNAQPHEGYRLLMHGQPYLYWKTLFRTDDMDDLDFMMVFRQMGLWLLMLLLVPALNLSGMISSRMERRLPEMGLRKAFGATGNHLFSQIVWENLLLTCLGGVLGLMLSFGMVLFAKDWLLTMLDGGTSPLPDGVQMSITTDMLFNPILFVVTFAVCVVLNLFSALIPACVALKKDIVYSLNRQK